jgi:hypothetical protein
MDEIDWDALRDEMPTVVILTEDEARKLSMRIHPSSVAHRPAFLSAGMN